MIIYLDYENLYDIYLRTVDISGGGLKGVIDKGKVEGILEQIKNDMYYPDIEDKVTYLFFSSILFNASHTFLSISLKSPASTGISNSVSLASSL